MTPRPATRAELVDAVRALPGDRACWVGIDGFGAAGKTALAAELAAAMPRCAIVALDDLQGEGITQWDWDTLHRDVVVPLLAGRDATYPIRGWGERAPRGSATVAAGSVVVVEGVSSTRREADVPWDLTVWLDVPDGVRRRRALDRDGTALQALWQTEWLPSERRYAARERPWERVDLVIQDGVGESDAP